MVPPPNIWYITTCLKFYHKLFFTVYIIVYRNDLYVSTLVRRNRIFLLLESEGSKDILLSIAHLMRSVDTAAVKGFYPLI